MGKDGGDRLGQILDGYRKYRLATTTTLGIFATDVEAVLGDIQVEIGEVYHAEVLNGLEKAEELKGLKGIGDFSKHLGNAMEHVPIQLWHVAIGYGVRCWIEIVQVTD